MYISVHEGINMDISSIIITVAITLLTVVMAGYVLIQRTLKQAKNELPDLILGCLDEIMPELPKLLAKEEIRQFVYSLGVLVGNGAKQGALGNVGKGKFKFEDLLGGILQEVAPAVVGKVLGAVTKGSGSETANRGDNW